MQHVGLFLPCSEAAEPPPTAVASKAVPRTLNILTGSKLRMVDMALPVWIKQVRGCAGYFLAFNIVSRGWNPTKAGMWIGIHPLLDSTIHLAISGWNTLIKRWHSDIKNGQFYIWPKVWIFNARKKICQLISETSESNKSKKETKSE